KLGQILAVRSHRRGRSVALHAQPVEELLSLVGKGVLGPGHPVRPGGAAPARGSVGTPDARAWRGHGRIIRSITAGGTRWPYFVAMVADGVARKERLALCALFTRL